MIAAVLGSGRRSGNGARLLEAAAATLAGRGAVVTTHRLADLTFRGCVGCGACRAEGGTEGCALQDDLTPALGDTARADALLLAAPIYYGYPSGLFKSYLDRWYSLRGPGRRLRAAEGRPVLLILTQGHPDPGAYEWTVGSLRKVLSAYGLTPSMLVAAGVEEAGSVAARPDLLAEASRLAADLLRG